MVTSKRRKILIKNIDILRNAYKITMEKFSYRIIAIVVLPDHIHMIIKPEIINEYPQIIRCIKTFFSKNVNISDLEEYKPNKTRILRNEKDVWQRRYWEHTIRNEKDLYMHLDYIFYNPVKHGYTLTTKNWEHSSFKKFVKNGLYDENWGNIEPENIKKLDYE